MTLDVILNYCAVAAAAVYVTWESAYPWNWLALLATFIALAIIYARRAELQEPSPEEQRSDFSLLQPKEPTVQIERRVTGDRRKEAS